MAPTRHGRPHSRFVEGSMKDRTSAAPPTHFLTGSSTGASVEDAHDLELQRILDTKSRTSFTTTTTVETVRPVDDGPEERGSLPRPGDGVRTGKIEKKKQPHTVVNKRSSRFLGQMWDGMRGKLRLRRVDEQTAGEDTAMETANAPEEEDKENMVPSGDQLSKKHIPLPPPAAAAAAGQKATMMTREQVLESYHDLVASGFFSSHAIQSTRHGPPPLREPPKASAAAAAATAREPLADSANMSRPMTSSCDQTETPAASTVSTAWPLLSNSANPADMVKLISRDTDATAAAAGSSSASTRGRKRAAAEANIGRNSNDERFSTDSTVVSPPSAAAAGSTTSIVPKKLRKLRSATSARFLSTFHHASASSTASLSTSDDSTQNTYCGQQLQLQTATASSAAVGVVPLPIPERGSSAGRAVSYGESASHRRVLRSGKIARPVPFAPPLPVLPLVSSAVPQAHGSTSNAGASSAGAGSLRGRRGAALGPDCGRRGVEVGKTESKQRGTAAGGGHPGLPPNFTFGEDRETGVPWRGLRVRASRDLRPLH